MHDDFERIKLKANTFDFWRFIELYLFRCTLFKPSGQCNPGPVQVRYMDFCGARI